MQDLPRDVLLMLATLWLISCGAFGRLSRRENARRAAWIAFAAAAIGAGLFAAAAFAPFAIQRLILFTLLLLVFVGAVLFLLPIGRTIDGSGRRTRRFDERDVVFARARLVPGTPEFEAYYAMRPENRENDDRVRALPGLLSPQAHFADERLFAMAESSFDVTETLRAAVDGPVAPACVEDTPQNYTRLLEGLALHLGAHSVGVTELLPAHFYSHIGRGTGVYGAPVELAHRFALAFTVEMDYDIMGRAPQAPVVLESARRYVDAAVIAIPLANL